MRGRNRDPHPRRRSAVVHVPGMGPPFLLHLDRNTIIVVISRTAQRLALGAIIAALACALAFSGAGSAAHAEDEPDGMDISVEVIGPDPSAIPPANPDRPRAPRGGNVTQTTITDPTQADQALGDEPFDLSGVLYVSGLTGAASPSFGPSNGTVTLALTIRNVSSTTFNSKARFWLGNAAGMTVADMTPVTVKGLKPAETRTISATMRRLGQWTVLHAHVTLTPPKVVEGTRLIPLTRDTTVVLAPLFTLSLFSGAGGLGTIGFVGWRRLTARGISVAQLLSFGRTTE